jgi:hypothetical protein
MPPKPAREWVARYTRTRGRDRGGGNKRSTWRHGVHGEANPLQIGRASRRCRQKIKVHSNPQVIYGVPDFRARVRPAPMNSIDSVFVETAPRERGASRVSGNLSMTNSRAGYRIRD